MTIYILQKYRNNGCDKEAITLGYETDLQKAEDEVDRLKAMHRELSGAYHSIGAEPTDPKILVLYRRSIDINYQFSQQELQDLQAFFDKQRLKAKIVFRKFGIELDNYSPDYDFRVIPLETYEFKSKFLETF